MTIRIDGDCLIYQSAFSAQKMRYKWRGEWWPSADDLKKHMEKYNAVYLEERKEGNIEKELEVFSEQQAGYAFHKNLQYVIDGCAGGRWKMYVSSPNLFRKDIYPAYKANRVADKPHHYDYVKQLVMDRSESMDGMEADDLLGMTHKEGDITASLDKDLDQIEGKHFKWHTNGDKPNKYTLSKGDCLYWLHLQLLMGDAVDNIPGCKGVGRVTAEKIIGYDGRYNPMLAFDRVIEKWKDEEALTLTGKLVYILRGKHDEWTIDKHIGRIKRMMN